MVEARLLGPGEAAGTPAEGHVLVGRPDRVALLVADDDLIFEFGAFAHGPSLLAGGGKKAKPGKRLQPAGKGLADMFDVSVGMSGREEAAPVAATQVHALCQQQ